MPKQLHFNEEARRALKRGVDQVSEAVKTTLGPRGRNVALDKKWGAPTVTHDGVTVAKEIKLKDPFENMGARLLVEVATKTNDVVGDGRLDDNGKRVPMNVKAGDKVLFAKYGGTEYKVDDVEYLILSEKDILGIISE